jgi:hypothetical protein
MRRRATCNRLLVGLVIASASVMAIPAVAGALTVSPAVGGQGTTFTIPFESECFGYFPEESGVSCDDEISLRGPQGTPCAGLLLRQPYQGFRYARVMRFRFGPKPPRPAFESSVLAYRVVRAWCPGTYTGKMEENRSGRQFLERFSFRVRRTRQGESGGEPPRGQEVEVPELPPVNPPGMRIRAITGGRVAVRFLVPPGEADVSVELDSGPTNTRCDSDGPWEDSFIVRPGRATLVIGGTGKRILRPNRRTLKTGGRLCRGRWIGRLTFFKPRLVDVPFTFVVR